MVGQRIILLLAACSGAAFAPVWATEPTGRLHMVAVAPGYAGQASAGDRWTIYLDGFIDSRAARRLVGVIEREGITDATVYFNSPGGSLVAAMALGRELRERHFATDVGAQSADVSRPRAGACYSACPFAYAGGVRRSLLADSELAVHRAVNRVPVPDEAAFQHVVARQVTDYLAEMGIGEAVLSIMSQVPHDAIHVLTPGELTRLNLVNDPAQAAVSGAK